MSGLKDIDVVIRTCGERTTELLIHDVKKLLGTVFVENKNEEEILRLLKKLVDKNDTEETLKEKANKIIMLKPNVYGIGLDLNELVRATIRRDK